MKKRKRPEMSVSREGGVLPGPKGLLLAIINRALLDAIGRRDYTEARDCPDSPFQIDALEWIFSDENEAYSFLWCCDNAKICARRIRRKIKNLITTQTFPIDSYF